MTNKEKYFGSSKDIAKIVANNGDPYCNACPIAGTIYCNNRFVDGKEIMSCQDAVEKWLDQEYDSNENKLIKRKDYVIEKIGNYKGMTYVIVFYEMGHRCAYIKIDNKKDIIEYKRDYNNSVTDLLPQISVHYGFTFCGEHSLEQDENKKSFYIGWDYIHYGDAKDLDIAIKYFPEYRDKFENQRNDIHKDDHIWTVSEIEEECKNVIDQLISIKQQNKLINKKELNNKINNEKLNSEQIFNLLGYSFTYDDNCLYQYDSNDGIEKIIIYNDCGEYSFAKFNKENNLYLFIDELEMTAIQYKIKELKQKEG